MPTTHSHVRQAGLASNLLAIALLTLPIPTQAMTQDATEPERRCAYNAQAANPEATALLR
ncbi:hypothetical protein [Pseudomonas sp.]|uniref:hypothetical protein n=1 Tax=Pseudomonas sp. TaxID=306 RepID=UPI002C2145CC|nr:hypothetical protein [Pseudomonas sp.]HUE94985.1 hypothetical protein [Pseudomonas sp.]